ncbi:hypothetical protein GDO81_017537 [Engystomops pustulosus]|uniref:Tankyrase 1-binding protein C-terminal domain-containing protein n=1 Tax=Engystomops pustulosus TaxID=76066 RepID=A0AAV7A6B9_ENGPU|nr:hypothetical protein GDO81_017537 [Engystomops pustulosus]
MSGNLVDIGRTDFSESWQTRSGQRTTLLDRQLEGNIGDSSAYQIALGNVDVNTLKKIDDYDPDVPQLSKQSSHSWDRKATASSNSIWQRNYTHSIKTEEQPKVTEKPKSRGLIIPSNKNQVKRPHEGGASESDLLSQYSFSQKKKPKVESDDHLTKLKSPGLSALQPGDDAAGNAESPPKARNKFAKIAQRKNEECGTISVPGTRSRFFCNPSDLLTSSVEVEKQEEDHTFTDCGVSGDLSPDNGCKQLNYWKSPSPASKTSDVTSSFTPLIQKPRNCFSWSGSLSKDQTKSQTLSPSLLSLHRFQRTKNVPDTENLRTDSSDKYPGSGDQISPVLTSSENKSKSNVVEIEDSSSEDLDKTEESACQFSLKLSPAHHTAFPESKPIASVKVSGLLKRKGLDSRSGSKLKPMARAKASGLSSRARPSQNNENRPGLQTTINDLWKNFSFKK